MRFFSLSREVLGGTLDCCPRLRAEVGRPVSLGGGMRVEPCSGVGGSSTGGRSSGGWRSGSGVWGEVSMRVAVRALW